MDAVLQPEDLSAADAARIMRFIGAARDAATIADAVGFREGRAIGLDVAQEIVAARRAGRLATPAALFGVTRVTPARFTEIAMALSAARPMRRPQGGALTVTVPPAPVWLGAPVALTVRRRGADGSARHGAPVSLIASWGRLVGGPRQGAAITLRTGPDGGARAQLVPPLDPPLTPDQTVALRAMLTALAPDAPAAARVAALRAMAGRYRAAGPGVLRTAIERLCGDPALVPGSAAAPPPAETVALTAVADGGAGPIVVAELTVLDWRPAFLGALAEAVRGGGVLDTLLGAFDDETPVDARLAGGVLAAGAAAETAETGRLARPFQAAATTAAMGRFLDARSGAGEGLETLVQLAGNPDATAGFIAAAAIDRVQPVRGTPRLPDGLDARFEALAAQLGAKADASALTDLGTRLDGALGTKADAADIAGLADRLGAAEGTLGTLDSNLQGIDERLVLADVQRGSLGRSVEALERAAIDPAAFGSVQAQLGRLQESTGALGEGLAENRADIASLDESLSTKADRQAVNALSGRIAQTEAGLSRVGGSIEQLSAAVEGLDRDRLDRLEAQFGEMAEALEAGGDLRAVCEELAAIRAETARLNTSVGTMQSALESVGARVDAKADAAEVRLLRDDVAGIRTENRAINERVGTIDDRLGRVVLNNPLRPNR